MNTHGWIIALGIIVYGAPFLGVPEDVRAYILFVCGFLLVVVGLVVRHETKKRLQAREDITYIETIPQEEYPRV